MDTASSCSPTRRRNAMCGQVTQGILTVLLGGVLLGGCGSSGKQADTYVPPPPPPDAGVTALPDTAVAVSCPELDASVVAADADCDEDALGVDWCIKNSAGGGGTVVTRQNPVPYGTCKL
jgi:hypothetical protein